MEKVKFFIGDTFYVPCRQWLYGLGLFGLIQQMGSCDSEKD